MSGNSKGFTLVEIMTVVLVMGILLALAVPNIIKYRKTSQAKACRVNLRSILAAVEEARLERASFIRTAMDSEGEVSLNDLANGGFIRRPSGQDSDEPPLKCPANDGSTYTISFSDNDFIVTCGSGKEGHTLVGHDND